MLRNNLLLIVSFLAFFNLYSMNEPYEILKDCSLLEHSQKALSVGNINILKEITSFDNFYDKEHGFNLDEYILSLNRKGLPAEIFYAIAAGEGSNYRVKFAGQHLRVLHALILTLSGSTFKYVQEFIQKCPLHDLNLTTLDQNKFTPLHQALYSMTAISKQPEVEQEAYNLLVYVVAHILRKGANVHLEDGFNVKAQEIEAFQWHKLLFEKCREYYQQNSFLLWRATYYFGEEQPHHQNKIDTKAENHLEMNTKLAESYKWLGDPTKTTLTQLHALLNND